MGNGCIQVWKTYVYILISKSGLQFIVESNSRLLWFCFSLLCDWIEKFAPLSQPMQSKAKTNRDLLARVSPRLAWVAYIYFLRVLIGPLACYVCFDWPE